MDALLLEKARSYLRIFCLEVPSRRVGSPGNRKVTDFFARVAASFGFDVETTAFDCLDWREQGAELMANDLPFEVLVSPYAPRCNLRASLQVISSLAELETAHVSGHILLLHGELAKEPLMPKNFPFYNPDEHRQIISLLEERQPAAIVAATSQHPEMAGAVYPFPLFEDGDFDIPSVYMKDTEGLRLAEYAGKEIALQIRARRIPARGSNVIARKGTDPSRRVVVFAHIDAKDGTPGALDNATGVIALLLLADVLESYAGGIQIELVAMNGEDYYSSPGEQLYLQRNSGQFETIQLGINLDGVGYCEGGTVFSLYGCPPDLEALIRDTLGRYPAILEGGPWYQGDHSLFLMNQRPALAFTSERAVHLLSEIVHTPKDSPDIVDLERVLELAYALHDLLLRLDLPAA